MHRFTDGLARWLQHGQRGASSETIVEALEGLPKGMLTGRPGQCHPEDASDFRRCVRLLDAVPAYRPRIHELRALSPSWAALVDHWAELEATLRADCPALEACDWSERTYQRMRFLLHPLAASADKERAEDLLSDYAELLRRPLTSGQRAAALRDLDRRCVRAWLQLATIRHEHERRAAAALAGRGP